MLSDGRRVRSVMSGTSCGLRDESSSGYARSTLLALLEELVLQMASKTAAESHWVVLSI